jgi:hypothetical protein
MFHNQDFIRSRKGTQFLMIGGKSEDTQFFQGLKLTDQRGHLLGFARLGFR